MSILHKTFACVIPKLPKPVIRYLLYIMNHSLSCFVPTIFSACLCPEFITSFRIPAWHMNAICHKSNRYFFFCQPFRNSGAIILRLTSPCKRLTPLTAPLPRIARYAILKLSDSLPGFSLPTLTIAEVKYQVSAQHIHPDSVL